MAVNLAHLNENIRTEEGLSVEVVKDEVASMDWCTAMALGFEAPPSRVDFLVESWRNLMLKVDPDSTTAYLARWHAKPVATSLLRLGAGVAGIYAVATITEARRKGIGAWVTLQPLLEARTRGYHTGILQSSKWGMVSINPSDFEIIAGLNLTSTDPRKEILVTSDLKEVGSL